MQILQNPSPRSTRRGFLLATSKSTKIPRFWSESSLSLRSNVPTSFKPCCKRSHFTATLSGNLSMRSPQSETRSRPMKEMDRRSVITGIVCGAAVATFSLTVIPRAAQSLPLGAVKSGAVKPQDLVEEARVTVHVNSRRRHRGRRWRCWWHRGRRVCGWRW